MDLSSLQNDLPRRKPSPPPPCLTADFKATALAVTKLYQNSARQVEQARQDGYLSAVQEVATLLSEGELAGDRLREWCAVGLSRITAQQDEENRTRQVPQQTSTPRGADDVSVLDEHQMRAATRTTRRGMTSPLSSPTGTRMQFPLQESFADSQFTFHSPSPIEHSSPFGHRGEQTDVTYDVIENSGNGGRKRGVNYQLGPIWDAGENGLGWGKRSRHI